MDDFLKLLGLGVLSGILYFAYKQYAASETDQNPIEGRPGKFRGSVQPGQKYFARTPLDARQDQGQSGNQPWAAEVFANLPVLAGDKPGDNNYSSVQALWDSMDTPGISGKNLDYYNGGIGN